MGEHVYVASVASGEPAPTFWEETRMGAQGVAFGGCRGGGGSGWGTELRHPLCFFLGGRER